MRPYILLPLITLVIAEVNETQPDDPSEYLPNADLRPNNFPAETDITDATSQLKSLLVDNPPIFDTSNCTECGSDEEFETGNHGGVISCKCVEPAFFHADMRLTVITRPIVSKLFGGKAKPGNLAKGFTRKKRLYWPKSPDGMVKIPYRVKSNLKHRGVLQKAFDQYKTRTCIRFTERTNENDYIKIGDYGGCWAFVGKTGGRQKVSIGKRCGHLGVVEHELMHVLGFFHEQSRPDRDDYVRIQLKNVIPGFESNFDKMTAIDSGRSGYDIESVMHYGEYSFTKNKKKTIVVRSNPHNKIVGQRNGFSEGDIDQINQKYCGKRSSVTTGQATNNALTTSTGSAGKPSGEKCENKEDEIDCKDWFEQGFCEDTHRDFMEGNCKRTCGFCDAANTGPGISSRSAQSSAAASRSYSAQCGNRRIGETPNSLLNRIVGGVEVRPGEFPWQASLRFGGMALCGGSWIGGKWILTAAHCLKMKYLRHYTVFLGLHWRKPRNNPHGSNYVSYGVEGIIMHENYNQDTMENDIALLKLKESVQPTTYISPVCLVDSSYNIKDGVTVTVSGWGDLEEDTEDSTPVLMKVDLRVLNRDQCKNWMPLAVADSMMCAGYENGDKDACQGDSGGPLTELIGGKHYQVGVVSWGIGCARKQRPGIYAMVSYFRPWIDSHIGN